MFTFEIKRRVGEATVNIVSILVFGIWERESEKTEEISRASTL